MKTNKIDHNYGHIVVVNNVGILNFIQQNCLKGHFHNRVVSNLVEKNELFAHFDTLIISNRIT